MPTADLEEGRGQASYKQVFGTASLASGDSIDTGLRSVESVTLTAVGPNGTITVTVDSISDGTVTVNNNSGGTVDTHYHAIGKP